MLYSFTTDISGKYSLTYLTNMSTSQKEEPSLLIEFESKNVPMAIVVDEYGEVSGIAAFMIRSIYVLRPEIMKEPLFFTKGPSIVKRDEMAPIPPLI